MSDTPDEMNLLGSQPVRVLEAKVLAWFEDKYPEFRQELEAIGVHWVLSRRIKYYCDVAPILAHDHEHHITPYIDRSGQIGLHETFMSYVWALSYSFMVIFDEGLHGPKIDKPPGHGYRLGHFLSRGYSTLNYGIKLLHEFQPWPESLPSPEQCSEEDQYYVTRANGIYICAADFILCHEVAHAACGHLANQSEAATRGENLPNHEIRVMEHEADQWALSHVIKGIREERSRTMVGFGAIAGLGALLFLESEITSGTHPDTDDRMISVLNTLCSDSRDNLWGVAATFFIAWNFGFDKGLDLPTECDTYEALFQEIVGLLTHLKRQEDLRWFGLD